MHMVFPKEYRNYVYAKYYVLGTLGWRILIIRCVLFEQKSHPNDIEYPHVLEFWIMSFTRASTQTTTDSVRQ